METLWAPWRMTYVDDASTSPTADHQPAHCVLCDKAAQDDRTALVVARGEFGYVMLNLYPYNNGHLMVVPYRHVSDLRALQPGEDAELHALISSSLDALDAAMGAGPDAFNVGLNMGAAAGAGIAAHLHWHIVPRWKGDTNFMPVLAETKVMPQHLDQTWQLLHTAFAEQPPKR